ncbi:hypothetical protein A2996_02370 [Candidatus Campbellbacteria bacterium RIFCSPLOWO2_01_FULL_34_15]|uniref:DUF5667 domain-containing protein n=2 Tax=Candidatus Campbelliibacteriota TaxID=1752727 RepID=A0A1F5ELW7_9BACT|nr:MAG: hypothetical protein A2811_01415 [Candidatus Campbellbacteria bacterium RIFCSPHIGHO2_01_FULL_34_10]OGD68391.1 MAG: hypothetical protein A2996_02370 [Candidatus Campbellbacteria bacterium RIFCSPLOWO2_01_FULL_34_15]
MNKNSIYFALFLVFTLVSAISFVEAEQQRACTLEAKICPDGSSVGRQGPNCEFAECPGSSDSDDDSSKGVENQERENAKLGKIESDDDSATSTDEDIATSTDDDTEDNTATSTDSDDKFEFAKRAEERRSRIANAVQEMIRVSDDSETVGEQIRVMAQEQNQEYEEAEVVIENVAKRGGFARFFIGPDYGEIKKAEQYVEKYNERLQKMGEEVSKVTAQTLVDSLNAQIKELEQVKTELTSEIEAQKGGFSLFGWLNRLLSK